MELRHGARITCRGDIVARGTSSHSLVPPVTTRIYRIVPAVTITAGIIVSGITVILRSWPRGAITVTISCIARTTVIETATATRAIIVTATASGLPSRHVSLRNT